MRTYVIALVGVLGLCAPARAELRFANIFGDNMVLQREKPIRVWGRADPRAKVAVTLTEDPAASTPYLSQTKGELRPDAKYSLSLQYVEKAGAIYNGIRYTERFGGGTTVDAWCEREALNRIENAKIKKILANYDRKATQWETESGRQAAIAEARQAFEANELVRWKQEAEKARKEGEKPPQQPQFRPPQDARKGWSDPAGMYNGVVLPIGKLSIRGVLWCQGENNFFGRWTQYQYTFPHLIPSFRKAFGDAKLPVAVFDLAGGMGDSDEGVEKSCVAGGYRRECLSLAVAIHVASSRRENEPATDRVLPE